MHAAAKYIGLPWSLGATGPDAFDCWGLVGEIQRALYGRDIPLLDVGELYAMRPTPENWATIRTLLGRTEWHRADSRPQDGDVALMCNRSGPHVGVVLRCDGRLGILHAMGTLKSGGAVIYTDLTQIAELGFARIEYWRHQNEAK